MAKPRIVIVGGVAAGATAAARARRINDAADITLVERGPYVSYANCGLPYFISGDIKDRAELLLQTPEGFDARYRVKVHVHTEALEIDRPHKRLRVHGPEGERWLPYDKLILAQGGTPVTPAMPGVDASHVFKLWTVPDMDRLDSFLKTRQPKTAVVVGGGFVGLEMAEAFTHRGMSTTVVEQMPHVMALMDGDMGAQVEDALSSHGVPVVAGATVKAIHPNHVELADGRTIPADVVLLSVGVRAELSLAKSAGLTLGTHGGLVVDDHLCTSDPDIYAAGDMVEVTHRISGQQLRIPLAGPANRQGRIAASNALGMDMAYGGALGTSIVKIFDSTAALTGLSEKAARAAGLDVGVAIIHKGHHAGYFPGAQELSLKLVYDRRTARLLGAQAFGKAGVDKRMDVLATALQGEMDLHDLAELDLSYAPPYSSANDPVNLAAFIGLNDVDGFSPLVTAQQFKEELAALPRPVVLDVRTEEEFAAGHVQGALNIPVDTLRQRWETLPRDGRILVHCRGGFRGHLALRILKAHGFQNVANVTGGMVSMLAQGGVELVQV